MLGSNLSAKMVGVLVVIAFGAGVGAASVAVLDVGPNPISAAAGDLNESSELRVSGVQNVYVGTNVTAIAVTVNDSDPGTATNFTAHLTVRDGNGDVLESVDATGQVTSGSETTVQVDLANSYSVGTVAKVEVVVESTG